MTIENKEKTTKEKERDRMINRECAGIYKYYRATLPARGLPPRSKVWQALSDLKKRRKDLSYSESIEFYDELVQKLEKRLIEEEK